MVWVGTCWLQACAREVRSIATSDTASGGPSETAETRLSCRKGATTTTTQSSHAGGGLASRFKNRSGTLYTRATVVEPSRFQSSLYRSGKHVFKGGLLLGYLLRRHLPVLNCVLLQSLLFSAEYPGLSCPSETVECIIIIMSTIPDIKLSVLRCKKPFPKTWPTETRMCKQKTDVISWNMGRWYNLW